MHETPVQCNSAILQHAEVRFHAGEHLLDGDLDIEFLVALLIVAHVEPCWLHVRLLICGSRRPLRVNCSLIAVQSQSPDRYFLPSQVISTPSRPAFATRPAPSSSATTAGGGVTDWSPDCTSFRCRKVSIASGLSAFIIATSA